MKGKRILAIDYGERRIGVAISDELQMFSARLDIFFVKNASHGLQKIQELVIRIIPEKIIIGIPYDYQAKLNAQSKKIYSFVSDLKQIMKKLKQSEELLEIPEIVLYDESFTTLEAEQGKSRKFKKQKSDSEAARLLLQQYLNSVNNSCSK